MWCFVVATLVFIVRDWPDAGQWQKIFSRDRIIPLFALIGCFIIATILRGIRWGLLLKGNVDFAWRNIIVAFTWCFFLGAFTPFRLGEITRLLWVKQQKGSTAIAAGTLIAERLADLLVLLLCIGIVIVFAVVIPPWMSDIGLIYLAAISAIYIIISISAASIQRWLHARFIKGVDTAQKEKMTGQAVSRIIRIIEGLGYLSRLDINIRLLALTLAIWSIIAIGFYSYLVSFFPDLHWTVVLAVMTAVNLSSLMPIAPGNLGLYEMAAILTLTAFAIPASDALVAAVGMHAVVLALIIFLGTLAKITLTVQGQKLWDVV